LDDVAGIATRYGLDSISVARLTGGVANSSFKVESVGSSYVVTVLDNHTDASAVRLVRLLRLLETYGSPSVVLHPAVDAAHVTSFHGVPIIVTHFVVGNCYEWLPSSFLKKVGEDLRAFHSLPQIDFLPQFSRRFTDSMRDQLASFADQEFADWASRRVEESRWIVGETGLPSGLVHGDIFSDNLIVSDDGKITFLDWETATHDFVVMDLAHAVLGLCKKGSRLRPERVRLLLSGYSASNKLNGYERILLRDSIIYAAVYVAWHRYYRHNILNPSPTKAGYYKEIPPFVDTLKGSWDEVFEPLS